MASTDATKATEPTVDAAAKAPAADDEDDVDLFGSEEEEDPEAAKVREERLAAYKEKKAAKPKVAAKSVVTMDIKPWGAYNPVPPSPLPRPSRGTDGATYQTTRPDRKSVV